jgi:hypothetical protein
VDVKLIEIRDRATFVPAMAMRVTGSQENLPPPRRDQLARWEKRGKGGSEMSW